MEMRCTGCGKTPDQLWRAEAELEGMTPDEYAMEDGTFNETNGHFLCDSCYIKAGMPVSEHGWKAP